MGIGAGRRWAHSVRCSGTIASASAAAPRTARTMAPAAAVTRALPTTGAMAIEHGLGLLQGQAGVGAGADGDRVGDRGSVHGHQGREPGEQVGLGVESRRAPVHRGSWRAGSRAPGCHLAAMRLRSLSGAVWVMVPPGTGEVGCRPASSARRRPTSPAGDDPRIPRERNRHRGGRTVTRRVIRGGGGPEAPDG